MPDDVLSGNCHRLRRNIRDGKFQIREIDCQADGDAPRAGASLCRLPALWAGLLYHQPALDAAFDFPLRWATVGVLAAEENGLSRRPASTLDEPWAYGAHSDTYRDGSVLNLMLGNHDFVRFGDLLQRGGLAEPDDPDWWARHRLAFMVQAAYSGSITRYYGEELGDVHHLVRGVCPRDLGKVGHFLSTAGNL